MFDSQGLYPNEGKKEPGLLHPGSQRTFVTSSSSRPSSWLRASSRPSSSLPLQSPPFLVDGAPGQSTFVKVISAAHTSLHAHRFKHERRSSTEPRRVTNDFRKRLKKKLLLLLLGGLLLGCRLLGGLLLSDQSLPPSLSDTDPRFHGLAGWIPSCDVMDDFFCTYLLCNPTGFATWPHR